MENKKPEKKPSREVEKIKPLKDHKLYQNEVKMDLKKGEEALVPRHLIDALKAEKVIN